MLLGCLVLGVLLSDKNEEMNEAMRDLKLLHAFCMVHEEATARILNVSSTGLLEGCS